MWLSTNLGERVLQLLDDLPCPTCGETTGLLTWMAKRLQGCMGRMGLSFAAAVWA